MDTKVGKYTCSSGNDRIALWDNVKFLLIFLVVVGHFIEVYVEKSHLFKSLFLFIYSFHMPLFIFVAGLFHRNKRIKEKVISYFSIYLAYKIVTISTKAAFGKSWSFNLFKEDAAPWFMFAMMVYICLAYVLRNVENKPFVLVLAIGLACLSGYDGSIGDFLVASRIIVFFPFYYLGTILQKEKLEQIAAKNKWKLIGLLIILVWFGVCYFKIDDVYILRHLFTGRNPFNKTIKPIGWIVRLGCYFITTLSGLGFVLMTPNKRLGIFTTAGARSLQIYFWHIVIRNILSYTGCLDKLVAMGASGKMLLLVITVGVALLCSTKLFANPTAFLMKAPTERREWKWQLGRKAVQEKMLLWIPIVSFFVFSVLFYGPLGIYLSNAEELWFNLWTVLKIVGVVSVSAFIILTLLGLFTPKKTSNFLAKLLFGVSLALYIQGNFINISYGSGVLDGSEIIWSDYVAYAMIDTLIWIACVSFPFIIAWFPKIRKAGYGKKCLVGLSIFFIVIQLPAMAMQFINYKPADQQSLKITTEGIYDLGKNNNVIVFVLDTYDERYFQELIEQHPEYQDKLKDFIHYDNYITSASRTIVAMPSLLTGQPFLRDSLYSEYIDRIWDEKNVLEEISNKGVDVRVFSDALYFSKKTTEFIANIESEENQIGSYKLLGEKLYKVVGFTFAPHLAKRYFLINTNEFDEAKEQVNNYSTNNVTFIQNYRSQQFSISNAYNSAFRLYHLDGVHSPFITGADGKKSAEATRETTSIALMEMILSMIEDMKQKGVYDDSTIIITADHGNVGETEWTLLLIKEANYSAPYKTSHLPISGFDLPIYWGDLFGISLDNQTYGMHLADITESIKRERHFFQNTSGSSRVMIREFKTDSYAGDQEALIPITVYTDDINQLYTLGTELSFEADATGNRYAVSGFEINTGWRTLLSGHEAILKIPISNLPKEGNVIVHLGVYTDDNQSRNAKIYANDNLSYEGTVEKSQNTNGIEFEVSVETIKSKDNTLTIRIILPDIEENDQTTRSFSLKKMWIK